MDSERLKENVTVTVRFRPLSRREIRQGEEIAWYADGETIVRNEYTSSIAYAYDKVFGPTTTTRQVYDIAAQHVVSGAMEGVNGTIFAYGVTSSGKTHTMHGDQRSPGIIPLAIKDAFSIIQETPCREFLLRLSYLEIYNEVVNDLLNPAGQHLRIREDSQGTFVEGVKEEVLLSPAHALSVIAAGEEQRHVASTNFNLHSSRSHTIFTLTIESSPCGENNQEDAVNLSQLNLIDLAGSESSKAETTGVRRKEGAYINKSLLTLGTVISKLTDVRAAHIPYRDSKLTRLLQSSLSGHGRVSLICTVTPSSSNSEETHNTLKFAHRAKHIEIQAAQNKSLFQGLGNKIDKEKLEIWTRNERGSSFGLNMIIDEKSLIKTYQNEIRSLKEELEQSEQEEVARDALLSQIQSLTKLILVSTKSLPDPGRRYSFKEEELAYLPRRRRDINLDHENIQLHLNLDGDTETKDDPLKEDKKIKKPGLLNWLKPQKRDALTSSSKSTTTSAPSTPANHHILPIEESRPSYSSPSECRSVSVLEPQLDELEVQDTDSQVVQEQVNEKNNESKGLQETMTALKRLLSDANDLRHTDMTDMQLQQAQALEIEELKQKLTKVTESKEQLESENKRLKEETSYAKELASAAAIELKMLSEEIIKLMNQNKKLSSQKTSPTGHKTNGQQRNRQKEEIELLKREVAVGKEREMAYEAILSEKDERESELQQIVMESKEREAYLENELANMWILVSKLRKSQGLDTDYVSESSKESRSVEF